MKIQQPEWVIVSFKAPTLWDRSETESWMFNPRRRYIINKGQLESLKDKVDTVTELKNSRHHVPLQANRNLSNASILVERHRDRGWGDYLFLTGPLNYLKHVSGNTAMIDIYTLSDRGQLLENHPALQHGVPLAGPVDYDSLHLYNYHWFIDSVTEYDEERDQANVYDALFKQLGLDPAGVDPRFKRPSLTLVTQDMKDLDSLYYLIFLKKKIDLRRTPYYLVAPSCNANIRSGQYRTWLTTIAALAKARPVVVIGQSNSVRAPATDMPYGSFIQHVDQMENVINLMGSTPIRVAAAMLSNAVCAFTMDSGMLYVAQALRVPAVSIWGPVAPASRIGYDHEYMELAIWNQHTCRFAGCHSYAKFPVHKCPRGEATVVCEPILSVTPDQIIEKCQLVESKFKTTLQKK